MTEDIVARLRKQSLWSDESSSAALLIEAADEIEQLRRKLSYLVHTDEDIEVQNKEIWKLKEMLEHMGRRLEEKDREIERLRTNETWTEVDRLRKEGDITPISILLERIERR